MKRRQRIKFKIANDEDYDDQGFLTFTRWIDLIFIIEIEFTFLKNE